MKQRHGSGYPEKGRLVAALGRRISPAPYHLNTIRGTGKVYVSSRSEPVIWVVDQKSLKLTDTIKLPAGEGHQMAVLP